MPTNAKKGAAGVSRPVMEAVEPRRLLSTVFAERAHTIPEWQVNGTRRSDVIEVAWLKTGMARVSVNGRDAGTAFMSVFSTIRVFGRGGNDRIVFRSDPDVQWAKGVFVSGGAGNDTIQSETGDDTLLGDGGNDRISGGDGRDKIQGGAGRDKLYGGLGSDTLDGGAGSDVLRGDAGNDALHGRGGNDMLAGDLGTDRAWGHRGNDVYVTLEGGEAEWRDRAASELMAVERFVVITGSDGPELGSVLDVTGRLIDLVGAGLIVDRLTGLTPVLTTAQSNLTGTVTLGTTGAGTLTLNSAVSWASAGTLRVSGIGSFGQVTLNAGLIANPVTPTDPGGQTPPVVEPPVVVPPIVDPPIVDPPILQPPSIIVTPIPDPPVVPPPPITPPPIDPPPILAPPVIDSPVPLPPLQGGGIEEVDPELLA